jgi:hypothetical protein
VSIQELAEPTPVAQSTPALQFTPIAEPTSEPSPTPTVSRVVFDDTFAERLGGWPNDPLGFAWFARGGYQLFARDSGRFVATGIPLSQPVHNVKISAQFHKAGGPPGGGFGLVVRDQSPPAQRDGRNQSGEYLVVEVGDRGDIGIWQRDETHWIDLVPWQHSEAVRPDQAANSIVVTTHGPALQLEVNGQVVAGVSYDRLPESGGVGLFVGGDLNQIILQALRIENMN